MNNYTYLNLRNVYTNRLQELEEKKIKKIEELKTQRNIYNDELLYARNSCPNRCYRLEEFIEEINEKIKYYDTSEHVKEYIKQCEPFVKLLEEQKLTQFQIEKFYQTMGVVYRPGIIKINGGGSSTTIGNNNNTNENNDNDLYICPKCNENRYYDEYEAYSICPKCKNCIPFQRETNDSEETMKNTIQFEYERENHLREELNKIIKAVEYAPTLPKELIRGIKRQIIKENITKRELITPKRIREWLRRDLKMSKYSEKIYSILYRVCKILPPQIPKALEAKYYELFHQFQIPFAKHVPAGRFHFFNYNYLLRKFNELLDQNHLLHLFPILKGQDRVHFQDELFEKCCKDLGLKYIPSI